MIPGVFAAGAVRGGGPAPGGDPYWANVVSLLHFNGTDGATTFTDQKGKTWTAQGDAQLDTDQAKFGASSLLLDGSGDYITTPYVAGHFNPANDFTEEAWVRLSSAKRHTLFALINNVTGNSGHYMAIMPDGTLRMVFGTAASWITFDTLTSGVPVVGLNTWTHIAITKQGSTVRAFIGGVLAGTYTLSSPAVENPPGAGPLIGTDGSAPGDASRHFHGHIDDLRFTDGVARYTAAFTPPTAPFPNGP